MLLIEALRQNYLTALASGEIPLGWSLDKHAIVELRKLAEREGISINMDCPTLFGLPISERTDIDGWGRLISAKPEKVSDADLLAAYQRTDGEPGNPEADALLAEIERRGLDI